MPKLIECSTLRGNSNANCKLHELWVIIICQCRFADCNKCYNVVKDMDNGGGYCGEERGTER